MQNRRSEPEHVLRDQQRSTHHKAHTSVLYAQFRDQLALQHPLRILREAGFYHKDLALSFQSQQGLDGLMLERHGRSAEFALYGGTLGFALGGLLGWFVGAGAIVVPILAPLIAAGPVLGSLAASAALAALGAIVSAVIGAGVHRFYARPQLDHHGGLLLLIFCADKAREKRAEEALAASEVTQVWIDTEQDP